MYRNIMDDYDLEQVYGASMEQLTQLKNGFPKYDGSGNSAVQSIAAKIENRPKFSYDPNDDALYQGYKQSYTQQGRLAMEDSMGQAAGLTGGYGSSYAQSVGQQQYGSYLQKLSEVYPELYSMAYNRYLDEGEALQNQYNMAVAQRDFDYRQYESLLEQSYRDMGIAQDMADTAYDRQQEGYDRLAQLIASTGYVPEEGEMQAVGMTAKQMEAYAALYQQQSSGTGGTGGKKQDTYGSVLAAAMAELGKGKDVEQVNGMLAQMVQRGELDAATAQQVMIALTNAFYS